MLCANCHRERTDGQYYETFYGRKVGKDEHFDVDRLAKIHTTHYLMAGQERSWICDRCANRTFTLSLWMFIIFTPALLAAMIGIFGGQSESDMPQMLLGSLACCGLPWIIGGVLIFVLKGRWRKSQGELFAKNATRKAKKGQGFDAFFTPSEYKRLEH